MKTNSPTLSSRTAIWAITLYQFILQPIIKSVLLVTLGHYSQCKHHPTCSQYTVSQIKTHGTIQGLKLGVIRIWNCR